MRLLPVASVAAMACRVRHREIGTATPPIRHRRETPSTRLTSAIAQEADSPAERRRQETDAHAAEVRQLWFK